jgi:hypothetical protein
MLGGYDKGLVIWMFFCKSYCLPEPNHHSQDLNSKYLVPCCANASHSALCCSKNSSVNLEKLYISGESKVESLGERTLFHETKAPHIARWILQSKSEI